MATSFKSGDKFYIGGDKLLPLEKYYDSSIVDPTNYANNRHRFLPKPKPPPGQSPIHITEDLSLIAPRYTQAKKSGRDNQGWYS